MKRISTFFVLLVFVTMMSVVSTEAAQTVVNGQIVIGTAAEIAEILQLTGTDTTTVNVVEGEKPQVEREFVELEEIAYTPKSMTEAPKDLAKFLDGAMLVPMKSVNPGVIASRAGESKLLIGIKLGTEEAKEKSWKGKGKFASAWDHSGDVEGWSISDKDGKGEIEAYKVLVDGEPYLLHCFDGVPEVDELIIRIWSHNKKGDNYLDKPRGLSYLKETGEKAIGVHVNLSDGEVGQIPEDYPNWPQW